MSDFDIWWANQKMEFMIAVFMILAVVGVSIGVGLYQVAKEMLRNAYNTLKRKR